MDWPLAGDRRARPSRGGGPPPPPPPDPATWPLATDPETHALRKVGMEAKGLPNGTKLEPKYRPSCVGRGPRESSRPESEMLRIYHYLLNFTMLYPHLPPSRDPTIDVLRPRSCSKSDVHKEMLKNCTQKSTSMRNHPPERPRIGTQNRRKFV